MLATQVVESLEQLAPLRDQWNRLCLAADHRTPFLSYAWISAWLEHRLRADESWFCVLAFEGERLLGVLPLVATPLPLAAGRRVVLRAPVDGHGIAGDALCARGREPELLGALFAAAARHRPDHLCIDLSRVLEGSGTLTAWGNGLGGVRTTLRPLGRGAYLPIRGRFEDYRAGLSGNFRSNLNKAANKLARLPGVRERFLGGEEASPELLPQFIEVEARSWKGQDGNAIRKSPAAVAFYTTLCERLAEAGWLEWHLLEADGRTLAANLAVRMGGTVYVWKLGYDEGYARCSPGGMLFERLLRRAHDEGLEEISLLTDQPWYERWQMRWRRYHGLRAYSPRLDGQAAWAVDRCLHWGLRQSWLRRLAAELRAPAAPARGALP